MNHTYRLLWNDRLRTWVAAPECARTRSKRAAAVVLAAALSAPLGAAPLDPNALPIGGRVTAGAAGIAQSGARMNVAQTTDRAIIDWQSFDIGSAASVRFTQPGAASVALNRVVAGDASRIFGQLSANGQVWLVNPAGVIFGAGSRVDVGGLVASTLDVRDDDFMAGRAAFSRNGATGKVVNRGTINAAEGGLVALLAPEARNEGVIAARLGSVVLAAGERVTLAAGAGGRLQVAVDPATVSTLVENRHLIQADGGEVLMSAKAADALLSAVVSNSGTVRARTLANREGRILLLADMEHGTTNVAGTLDASAPDGGNGGFVETSAAHVKVADGTVVTTLGGNGGHAGTWLIDPQDYTIATIGGDISGPTLSTNLGGGPITIFSSGGGTSGSGDINVNDAVSWNANTLLTLTATRNINVRATITAGGASTLTLNTATGNGGEGAVAGGRVITSGGGKVNFPGRSGAGFLTINGEIYTVINTLGLENSTTGTDLQGMYGTALANTANLSGKYALGADIAAGGTSLWAGGFKPVGPSDHLQAYNAPFTGKFDGLGHTISNLSISRTEGSFGLFGYTNNAVLQNVGLLTVAISGGANGATGALVGDARGATVIRNCYVDGGNVNSSTNMVGGLVGFATDSTAISYSHTNVIVLSGAGGGAGLARAGGLVGRQSGGSISNSYATGSVTANNATASENKEVGGLVGSQTNGSISNSYATGAVSGYYALGGLVGSQSGGSVSNSYATGSVSGNNTLGGLVGSQSGGSVTNSYATGAVSGTHTLGGLVGNQTVGTVTDSYWDITTTGRGTSAGGTEAIGLTTDQWTTLGPLATGAWSSTDWGAGSPYPGVKALPYITITASASQTYGSAATIGIASILDQTGANASGLVNTAGLTWTVLPNNTLSGTGASATGYQILYAGSLTYLPASLTVTANNASKPYDGLAYSGGNGVSYSGFVNGETLAVLGGALTYGGSSQGAAAPGSYVIAPAGLTSGNYAISYVNGTLDIAKAALTVTARNVAKTYDGLAWSGGNGVTYAGFINGETETALGGTLAWGGNGQGAKNTGSYTLAPSGLTSNKYDINFIDGALTIAKAPLTVTATAASKTYDGLAWSGNNGASYAGFVNGETTAALGGALAWGGSAQGAKNPGVYAITLLGLTSNNYDIAFVDGAYTIAKAPLTVTAANASKTYDGLPWSGNNGVSYAGFVNGESTGTLGGTLAWGGTAQGAKNAGTYAIAPSGWTSNNYAIAYVDGTLTIDKTPLTVTALDASKFHNAQPHAGGNGVRYAGFVNGETPAVLGGTLDYTGSSQSATDVGSYAITPTGLASGNYRFDYVDGALKIDARPVDGASVARFAQTAGEVPALLASFNDVASLKSVLTIQPDFIRLPEE